ncbi:MAG: cation:proton antiporter [Dehalococcoidales bacterium]|nr:cation:proton antiporter [Dehalococcoidales bacterium]
MDMENIAQVIAFVGILVFLAHLFTGIFSRTRIPDVIPLIFIGICVGPWLGLASPAEFGEVGPVFTTVTLIIILFESGLALRLSMLRAALGGAMVLAPLSFFSTMAVTAGLAIWLTDLEVLPAFILGAIVGSTSETVVIPLIRQLKIKEETTTLLSVESSVNDVLSIVITVALVQAYVVGRFEIASVSGDLIASFLVALVFGIIGALVWSILLNKIHALKNAMFTTPAFVFVIYGIVETLGFSGAIAALAFGVTIGNIETIRIPIFKSWAMKEPVGLNATEKIFFSEVAFLLKTFFFIYLGISLELISSWFIIVGLILTAVAFVLRIPAVKLSVRQAMGNKDFSVMAVMVPKGLAAVVLASIPLQQGVAGGEIIKNITYGVVLFSIVITSILVLLLEKTRLPDLYAWIFSPTLPKFGRKEGPHPLDMKGRTDTIVPSGEKLFGGEGEEKKKPPGKGGKA